jgi:hypothetical protein
VLIGSPATVRVAVVVAELESDLPELGESTPEELGACDESVPPDGDGCWVEPVACGDATSAVSCCVPYPVAAFAPTTRTTAPINPARPTRCRYGFPTLSFIAG